MRMTKQELTDYTIVVWQPRLRRRLSKEDVREITENITGFFTILAEWSHREERNDAEVNTNGGADA